MSSSKASSEQNEKWKTRLKKASKIACLLVAGLLTWLLVTTSINTYNVIVLRPRPPELRMTSLSSRAIHVNHRSINATWDLKLLVASQNPKLPVRIDNIQVLLAYRSTYDYVPYVLAAKQVAPPPCLKPGGDQTTLEFKLETLDSYANPDLASRISDESAVTMSVKVLVWWAFDTHTQRFIMENGRKLQTMCQWVEFQFHRNNGSWTDGESYIDDSIMCSRHWLSRD